MTNTENANEEITVIAMINNTRRSFQGIKPGQVISVDEADVAEYERNGFSIVKASADETVPVVEDDQSNQLTKKDLIAKLKDLKVEFKGNMSRDELQAIYDEAIKGNEVESASDDDLGLGDKKEDDQEGDDDADENASDEDAETDAK